VEKQIGVDPAQPDFEKGEFKHQFWMKWGMSALQKT